MPEEAPVITIVLPSRRFAIAVAIVRLAIWQLNGVGKTVAQWNAGGCRSLEKHKNCFLILLESIQNHREINMGINGTFELQGSNSNCSTTSPKIDWSSISHDTSLNQRSPTSNPTSYENSLLLKPSSFTLVHRSATKCISIFH